jgi:hypothetical protein
MKLEAVIAVGGCVLALSACSSSSAPRETVTVTASPTTSAAPAASTTASSTAVSTAAPASAPVCGPDQAAAVKAALSQLPPEAQTGMAWNSTPIDSNYNPCADLSTVLVMIEKGTASSPVQALMFHHGEYLGTGTSKAYGFTSLNKAASTGDMVVLDYKLPGECDACPPAAVNTVRYQWQGDHVAMLDPAPPAS